MGPSRPGDTEFVLAGGWVVFLLLRHHHYHHLVIYIHNVLIRTDDFKVAIARARFLIFLLLLAHGGPRCQWTFLSSRIVRFGEGK